MPPRAVWPFFGGFRNSIEDERHKVGKVSCFTVHFVVPTRAARIWQPYPGFALVGRCGTGTVRSGGKAHGKIRHFWNEGRVFLGREACLARGRVENTCRMRSSTPTLPPWPIDCSPKMPHLPAMAAKLGCYLAFGACLWGGAICAHGKTRHFGHFGPALCRHGR